MKDDFEQLVGPLLDREGGFVDHPDDRGGRTRWGITQQVARQAGYSGEMQALPRALAIDIYRQRYWTRPQLDQVARLSGAVAAEMLDTAVNMGPGVAVLFLQRALNALNAQGRAWPDLAVDGLIGVQTLQALAAFLRQRGQGAEQVLVRALDCLQGARYVQLAEARPRNESFVYGWLQHRIGQAEMPGPGPSVTGGVRA